jgi:hypothetical protein
MSKFVGGWFEEYSVVDCCLLLSIVGGWFEEYSVVDCCGLVWGIFCCRLLGLVWGIFCCLLLPIVVGWFEEYSVAYCCLLCGWFEEYCVVGLRNILLPIVAYCCRLLWVCLLWVFCVVNVDKDRRGGWMEGDGKGLGCIRINLILPI